MRRRLLIWTVLMAVLVTFVPSVAAQEEAPQAPLILIHGLAGSPNSTWGVGMQYFETKGYVQGSTLFAIDLRPNLGEAKVLGVLSDATYAADQIRRIAANTNASQVDLVGTSRGGLIVRLLATGDLAPLIRRAVSIDAPHDGVLSQAALDAILDYAQVDPLIRVGFSLPPDIQAGSPVLKTMLAREARFADRRAPALAIGSTFPDGHIATLVGNDGFVTLASQQAWPWARKVTNKIGPTLMELLATISERDFFKMIGSIPHAIVPESSAALTAVYEYLHGDDVRPARACEPACQDWTALVGHWSSATVTPMLPDFLPYDLDTKGNRVFDPQKYITRAEMVYALVRATGLNEQLGFTTFTDLYGHWAFGYVEAAAKAKLVTGITADSFAPDRTLSRAEAATLIFRVKSYEKSANASRFSDAKGHWAEAFIEAAAENGIIKGDEAGFRPNAPLTLAEAAVILSRAFPR